MRDLISFLISLDTPRFMRRARGVYVTRVARKRWAEAHGVGVMRKVLDSWRIRCSVEQGNFIDWQEFIPANLFQGQV